ncbi:helix-turn-helix transcriptional regulator [bacterium]|nr:helix-turn-helix transcriptional regulator [bacterium]
MVGAKLRKLRKEKGWTQKQLEERTGIDQKNISSYEADKLKPSPRTIQKFAQAFEVEVRELVGDNPSHATLALQDDELLQLFRDLQHLPEADVNHVKWMISLAIKQHRVQSVMAS